jgi:hypothetical protein
MQNLKFQLVIQFPATSLEEFDALIRLETALNMEKEIFLDGHDFGMGEFNIFIHTNEPRVILERVGDLIKAQLPGIPFAAGYRDFSEDNYIPLWPTGLESFVVA